MSESKFNSLVDGLLFDLEDALDQSGLDLDYETANGVLTITCENNGSQVIVSRQSALSEVWVAARSGGYHLAQAGSDKFFCKLTGETFHALISRVLEEQCGEPVNLSF